MLQSTPAYSRRARCVRGQSEMGLPHGVGRAMGVPRCARMAAGHQVRHGATVLLPFRPAVHVGWGLGLQCIKAHCAGILAVCGVHVWCPCSRQQRLTAGTCPEPACTIGSQWPQPWLRLLRAGNHAMSVSVRAHTCTQRSFMHQQRPTLCKGPQPAPRASLTDPATHGTTCTIS